MGRTSDEEGETSTKTCKSDIDDRPLKKARYVWQIKGKYHLKKPDEDKSTLFLSKTNVSEERTTVAVKHLGHVECKINSSESDYQVIETTQESVEGLDLKLSEDERILSDDEDDSTSVTVLTGSNAPSKQKFLNTISTNRSEFTKRPTPVSKVLRSTRVSSTWQLRKWQARQVARCFVDNTINRVLEDMGFVPLPVDADDIVDEEFPMTESENDDGLEDEAVLMAIHSHGLQRNEGTATGLGVENKTENDVKKVEPLAVNSCNKEGGTAPSACACSLAQRVTDTETVESLDPFHQRPVNKLWDRIELDTERYHELETMSHQSAEDLKSGANLMNRWCSDVGLFGSVINSDSCDSDIKFCEESFMQNIKQDPIIKQEDAGTLLVSKIEEVVMQEPKNVLPESVSNDLQMEDKIEEKSSSSFEHNDFLDKAVAVAIQKKGLSTLSCTDYG